jgi:hypothetical protein
MDWPVIGAVSGVAALAVAVTLGTVAMVRSAPEPPKRTTAALAPLLRFEPRPEVGILNGPQLSSLNPADYGPGASARVQPPAAPQPQATPPQAAPVRKNPPTTTPVAKPVHPPEQLRPPPAQGPVAARPLPPDPRLALPKPQFEPPKVDHRYDGVLTLAEISRIKTNLRLTPQQEPQWRPVEAVMRDIGRQQTAQVQAGRKPEVDNGSVQRLYMAAQPLLGTLRPDQKEQIRKLARQMGYASVASMI